MSQSYRLGTLEASEALIRDLYIELRSKVNAWSEITQQTPQARMGYIGQHLVSVVTGYPGGKSGARGYDLVMRDGAYGEIKTCYRVDQLGRCMHCGTAVSSLETTCPKCGSLKIDRKDDSKWLLSFRNDDEFARMLNPYRYYFVLFEFSDLNNRDNNDIEASIWEVDPSNKGFAFCMIDYYLNIRTKSKSKAPFNMWPHQLKFALTKPALIYKSIIRANGTINTIVFPTIGNGYDDELLPLTEYSNARTITIEAASQVYNRLSGKRIVETTKKRILCKLEEYRKENHIQNSVLCDLLAEEIYLPLIVPHIRIIPPDISKQFSELR